MTYTVEIIAEKFSVVDPDTGEVVVDKQALKKDIINRGVYLLNEKATLETDFKELLNEAKELDFDKTQIKKLIEQQYQYTLDEKLAELELLKTELNNLFGDEDV